MTILGPSGKKIWKPKANPWEPADYDDDVLYAVRAFHGGHANDVQQKLVWEWLLYVCGDDDWQFRPDDRGGQRATDVALGKQYVAKQFRKMLSPVLTPPPPALEPKLKPKRR